MKYIPILLLILLVTAPAFAENPYLNLGFEDGEPGSSPRSWYAGGEGYTGEITTDNPHGGAQCLQLKKTDLASEGFGVATSSFPIEAAAGTKLRYSGWIRTAGVTEAYAGLWWRADGPDGPGGMLAFDNMSDRGVTGSTEWTQYTIELDIPAEVTNINFGCILPGNGTAWFDDLQVELDGEIYGQEAPEPIVTTPEQVAWITETAYTFDTDRPDDPAHPEIGNEDLSFLKDLVGDARIVSLGEGTHGTAEFFRMKHRITRYLAQEMGFTLFGIEATMPEAELLNDYVLTGEGDPAKLIAGMYFWTWRTQEVLDMVQWMRRHNEQGGHIEFHGFDMQSPSWAMKTVLDFVTDYAPDLMLTTATTCAELRGLVEGAQGKGRAKVPDRLAAAAAKIMEELASRREDLVKSLDAGQVDWVIQNARLVEQYCRMGKGNPAVRDLSMADNVDWLLAQAGPDARIVLWAHNGHVARTGYSNFGSMGMHLDARHGQDMVVLGFHFHTGTYTAMKRGEGLGAYGTSDSRPGTVEWAFHQTGRPRLVLDLRKAEPGSAESGWVSEPIELRSIGAMAMDDAFGRGVMADRYDALIYFETSTPSVLLDVEAPSAWAVWDE